MSKLTLVAGAAASTPAAGKGSLFLDSADKLPRWIDDTGVIREVVGSSAVLTADTANQTSNVEAIISPQLTLVATRNCIGLTVLFDFVTSCAAGAVAQTTPGIVYRLRWGGLAGTIICTANNVITPATLLAATAGRVRGGFTLRTLGATGTAKGWLDVVDPRIVREATTGGVYSRVGKSGGPVTIDTTTNNILCVTAQCTVVDAAAIMFGESGISQRVF